MATKWSELRERVPAVNELLETPPLRALTERLNRSVVAAGVRSFMHELKADFERRRAEGHFPSLTELAARAAQHVVRMQQQPLRPAINATGRLLCPAWSSRPLADDALQAMVVIGHNCVAASRAGEMPNGAAAAIARRTGAETATVVHSYSGAIWLALSAMSSQKQALVARADVGDVEPGCSLVEIAASASTILHEVGSVNRTSAADYETAVHKKTTAILRHRPDAYRVVGENRNAELEELAAVARERELVLIDAIGYAPLVAGLPGVGDQLQSAAASIAAGANLVLLRGDGLVGGPRCGILVGNRDIIRRIESHPLFSAWQAPAMTLAALESTIGLYDDPQQLQHAVPIFQLLSASVENLRYRAEHLAPQLAQAADVAAAEAVLLRSEIGFEWRDEAAIASWGVALAPAGGDVDSLDKRLRAAVTPVVGRRENGRLVLDLRSVLARDDQRLATMVVGVDSAVNQEESLQPVGGA